MVLIFPTQYGDLGNCLAISLLEDNTKTVITRKDNPRNLSAAKFFIHHWPLEYRMFQTPWTPWTTLTVVKYFARWSEFKIPIFLAGPQIGSFSK